MQENGQKIEIEPRNIEIYNIELIKIDKENKTIYFKVDCSKGTYIRSLCEDIAQKLGTVGFMKNLNRTQVGEFSINEAITFNELEENISNINFLDKYFISLEKIFEKSENLILNDRKLELFLNGVMITEKQPDGIYKIYNNKKFIGTGIIKNELLKRDIII